MKKRNWLTRGVCALACCVVVALAGSASASAASSTDAFYQYTGSAPLSSYTPGTVLKSRTIPYHITGLPTLLSATQLLYRTEDAQGRPSANVTTVVQTPCIFCLNRDKVISYQSFYDSLNPDDEPSVQIAGGLSLTGIIPQIETLLFSPFLSQGYTIVIPDTQGQTADFAAGPEYGTTTLDSIRAAINAPSVKLSSNAKVALMGYSGGAIATEWASELAPSYAPEINDNLVGASFGGVLVDPAHNLSYVEGSQLWGGTAPMALIGIARAYDIDLSPYVSSAGADLVAKLQKASILNVLGQYPGIKWSDFVRPEYPRPESIPAYVSVANKLIMGTGGTPTIPMQIGQGTGGEIEGTQPSPTYGKGDGVMIAGDVRTLARQYCAAGNKVQYTEYPGSHTITALQWLTPAISWTQNRFGGSAAPQNCSSIAPGNPLTPVVYTP